MKIFYGIHENYVDITNDCIDKLMINDFINIPSEDVNRKQYLNDHIPNVQKHIKIIDDDNNVIYFYEGDLINIKLNDSFKNNNTINIVNIDQYYQDLYIYDRNIPEEYLNKFIEYQNKNKNNLNFEFMKNNINNFIDNNQLKETIFNQLIPQDTFRYDYLKLMTMDILLNKSLSFKCLLTNNIYRTKKSFYHIVETRDASGDFDDLNIYIFDEPENPFVLAIGNGSYNMVLHTNIIFIFYYKSNILFETAKINHWKNNNQTICREIKNIIDTKNIFYEKNNNAFMIGFSANIGHSYWNDLSGFKFLVDMDLLKYVDKFIIGPFDYYYVKDYLIKNNYSNIENILNINDIDTINNDFLFKYNDMFMYEDLKNMTIENINYTDDILIIKKIEFIKKNYYPILTFNLRGVYRNLYNQEEAITFIINKLLVIFPNMYLIFDGYVINNNTNIENLKSEGIESNCDLLNKSYYDIVSNIINKINTANFISLIGTDLNTQLKFLEISNYGLMQLGAGSFNYTWTMNKKCLYIGRNNYVNDS